MYTLDEVVQVSVDDVVAGEVRALRSEVEDVSRTLSAMARTSGFPEALKAAFQNDELLAEVLLAVGPSGNTQTGIVEILKTKGKGSHQVTVSRKLKTLDEEWDLIRGAARDKEGTLYVQTRLAKDLKVSSLAARVLRENGKSVKKKKA